MLWPYVCGTPCPVLTCGMLLPGFSVEQEIAARRIQLKWREIQVRSAMSLPVRYAIPGMQVRTWWYGGIPFCIVPGLRC